jgi:hypothetical protein
MAALGAPGCVKPSLAGRPLSRLEPAYSVQGSVSTNSTVGRSRRGQAHRVRHSDCDSCRSFHTPTWIPLPDYDSRTCGPFFTNQNPDLPPLQLRPRPSRSTHTLYTRCKPCITPPP